MIVSPLIRLSLLILAGVIPVWQRFVSLSQDFTLRGLATPLLESFGIACVITIARTKNPLVDGEQPVTIPAEKPPKITISGKP